MEYNLEIDANVMVKFAHKIMKKMIILKIDQLCTDFLYGNEQKYVKCEIRN